MSVHASPQPLAIFALEVLALYGADRVRQANLGSLIDLGCGDLACSVTLGTHYALRAATSGPDQPRRHTR
jgi:hypothetical protein